MVYIMYRIDIKVCAFYCTIISRFMIIAATSKFCCVIKLLQVLDGGVIENKLEYIIYQNSGNIYAQDKYTYNLNITILIQRD